MNGFAGLRLSRNRKQEKNISSEHAPTSLRASDGRVAGRGALIADPRQESGFELSGADLTNALLAETNLADANLESANTSSSVIRKT
jgi:uncharacterized protein YjbI with pentapeptide repeats